MRWCAGIVNHGGYDDLERCLAGLAQQVYPPAAIAVYDTGECPDQFEAARSAHPEAAFEMGPNRGYAGGANQVVDRLVKTVESVDFILLLNPDVELESEYASRLTSAMLKHPRIAIGTGKLLRPDRMTLDSAGITIPRNRRPRDRGSDRPDVGQFDVSEFVDAASGAAMMLRVAALDDLAIDGELFDESFFAYHEDTDLCWRARLSITKTPTSAGGPGSSVGRSCMNRRPSAFTNVAGSAISGPKSRSLRDDTRSRTTTYSSSRTRQRVDSFAICHG